MRAFVSVAGPGSIGEGVGSSPTAPPHLTLAFLGGVPDERSDALVASVTAAVAARPAFEMTLAGYGAFPSATDPRVVFREVGEGADALAELADDTRRALERDGFALDRRPFVPHLTVLRVRGSSDRARARALLAGSPAPPSARVRVREVVVNASQLGRGGATHTVIGRCPLATAPG